MSIYYIERKKSNKSQISTCCQKKENDEKLKKRNEKWYIKKIRKKIHIWLRFAAEITHLV